MKCDMKRAFTVKIAPDCPDNLMHYSSPLLAVLTPRYATQYANTCPHRTFGWRQNAWVVLQGDSFGTRPKKMRISQRLFITFKHAYMTTYLAS